MPFRLVHSKYILGKLPEQPRYKKKKNCIHIFRFLLRYFEILMGTRCISEYHLKIQQSTLPGIIKKELKVLHLNLGITYHDVSAL